MGFRHFYCSICGVVLAPSNRSGEGFPLWCKAVRAISKVEQRTILTGIGIVDNDIYPLYLPIEGVPHHIRFKDTQQDQEGPDVPLSCFPFHAACWELYSDYSEFAYIKGDLNTLFTVLNSIWYSNGALNWGHDYGGAGSFQGYRWLSKYIDSPVMADPRLSEDLLSENEAGRELAIDFAPKALSLGARTLQAHDPFRILPYELISEILLYLPSADILNLRLSSRVVALTKLSVGYWKSRFWPRNELGFAGSLRRPENYKWENWYVLIREQCKNGANQKNLMNRKRIWHLAGRLVELVSTAKSRVAFGSPMLDLSLERSLKVACVPPRKFPGRGCRELTHRAISFDYSLMSQLRGLKVTSVVIGDRRFISGVRFVLDSGNHTCLGYVDDSKDSWMGYNGKSRTDLSIQMLFGSEGFETITLESIPLHRRAGLPMAEDCVFARIPLRYLRGLMIGLDVRYPLD
ncbi:hypothetical protein GP486_004453 [Trichoglossum hirsutum]|uniref:F-box domain-containing protein n=1 Tax=Trichoglossum hirsutum TaxID=265104 RepID=A0A9P8RP31_9PEZI|nr:hypothetical protein GP486_004453 [Trichoglossum hirsutum]